MGLCHASMNIHSGNTKWPLQRRLHVQADEHRQDGDSYEQRKKYSDGTNTLIFRFALHKINPIIRAVYEHIIIW
jgi:hypothetical protein